MNKFHCSAYLVITIHPDGIISFLFKQSAPVWKTEKFAPSYTRQIHIMNLKVKQNMSSHWWFISVLSDPPVCHPKRKSHYHKISARSLLILALTAGVWCMWVCPCRTNIEFHFLYWSSEMSEEWYSVEKARTMERELDPALWQWVLSCLLQRGVFSEAPNFNLPFATSSPELPWNDFRLFPEKQDWVQRSSFCIKRRNSTQSDITSHKHTKISSRGVSTAGANVHMQKGRTSRVTWEGFICIHFITKYAQGLGTSWSSYVHVHNHR